MTDSALGPLPAATPTALAPGSRRTMRASLDGIARLLTGGRVGALGLPWHELRHQHAAGARALLAERCAPATANKALAALQRVLQEAWRLGLMDAESYRRAADVRTVRGATLPKGRGLSAGELRALFGACAVDQSPRGVRDAALLALLYGVGLRRSEPVELHLADIDLADGSLSIRRAKGTRTVGPSSRPAPWMRCTPGWRCAATHRACCSRWARAS